MTGTGDLDYPFKIEHLPRTRHSRNQTTGELEGGSDGSPTEISGNYSPSPLTTEFRNNNNRNDVYNEGEAQLFTTADISIGDTIRVYLDKNNNSYKEYRVEEVVENYGLLESAADPNLGNIHISSATTEDARTEYRLVLEDEHNG